MKDGPAIALNPSIAPRLYQQRLFAKCIEGGNTLVVLPTGLGKTLIAAMLAVYRLNRHPGSKVAFLAPTKPLVLQHQATLAGYLSIPAASMPCVTGEVPPAKRREAWEGATICFMTPQTLENDVAKEAYTMERVSLLVIDEAHRAVGDYAYTSIARMYVQQARERTILAMTASPGASREKIEEIKGNLFIDRVEVRDENDDDVKPYVHDTKINWLRIDLPKEFLEIEKILSDEFAKVEQFIVDKGLITKERGKQVTRMDLLDIIKKTQDRIKRTPRFEDKQDLFSIIKLVSIGLKLSYAIELIETQGLRSLGKYLQGTREEAAKPDSSASNRIFADLVFRKGIDKKVDDLLARGMTHPKVEQLREIVSSFLATHAQSRVIVFSNYRATVATIVDDFKEHGIDRVERFVGQQASKNERGMSQKVQAETIARFNSGDLHVLVATSVAEEGLDIGQVDLVVFYDVVPSAIRTIQRKGRTGRKRTGKVVVMMAKGTRDEAYFHAEKYKERQMRETLGEMKGGGGRGSGALDEYVLDGNDPP